MRIDEGETVESIMYGFRVEGLDDRRRVIVAHPEYTVADAKRLFQNYDLHHLPIVAAEDDETVIGIVSLFDLIKGADRPPSDETTLETIMTRDPQSISKDTPIRDAVTMLATSQFTALPVVDPDRKILGIVTSRDIVTFLHERFKK